MIRLSTFATPGAAHAALSASWRSAHDRTVPLKDYLVPRCFDGDAACIQLRRSPQCFLDLAPDLHWRDPRLDFDGVGNALEPTHPAYCFFRSLPLVIPFDLAFECQKTIFNDQSNFFPGKR